MVNIINDHQPEGLKVRKNCLQGSRFSDLRGNDLDEGGGTRVCPSIELQKIEILKPDLSDTASSDCGFP